MFYFKEPSAKKSPWILSHYRDEKIVSIPANSLKDIKNYQILGVDFLYQNYKNQFKGAILNEEEGMNMPFQVATFLNAMLNYVEPKFQVLVVVPDRYIANWHYHLCVHAGLKVQLITPKTCPEDFDQEHGLALLLSFSDIKLGEYLVDYDYFSVIVDDFDKIASKLVFRKLRGLFNIGLTQRSFYNDPDQKLQWTMLNWSNPGCVGKLGQFYEVDNDNFANFRDNYRHWWFRLTWNFCESFKKPTELEQLEYSKILSKWMQKHHLPSENKKEGKKVKKRKQLDIVCVEEQVQEKITRKTENFAVKTPEKNPVIETEGTVTETPERGPNYVKLPSMDENPILNSIIRTLEKSPEPILMHSPFAYTPVAFNADEPNCSKAFEEENVLIAIIDDETPMTEEAAFNLKKEELRSQIFSEQPCTSKSLTRDEDSEFFRSLIDPDVSEKNESVFKRCRDDCTSNSLTREEDSEFFRSLIDPDVSKKSESVFKRCRSDDIDEILRETEVLLKQ